MSFREKSAWITLITLIVLTLFYVTHLPPAWLLQPPGGFMFHVLTIGVGSCLFFSLVVLPAALALLPRRERPPGEDADVLPTDQPEEPATILPLPSITRV